MKSSLSFLMAALSVALLVPATLSAHCGHCGSEAKHEEAAPSGEAKASDEGGAAAATPATTAGDSEAKYVCPMHPEVTSDKPSDCPKCGMKLEPAGSESGAKEGAEGGEAAPPAAGSGSDK